MSEILVDLGLGEFESKPKSVFKETQKHSVEMYEAMYVQIPDGHIWDKNIGSNKDYVKQMKHIMNNVREEIVSLRTLTKRLYVIWDGDVFHKGFKNMDEFGYWMTWFIELRSNVDGMFATVGNHEFSGYKSNPFWHLLSELESQTIPQLKGVAYTPKGKMPILRVVDTIAEGNWHIHCVHYGTLPMLQQPRKNVGIFHSSIIDSEIERVLKDKYGRDPLTGFIDHSLIRSNKPFKGMEYAFIAHMHRAYGLFTIEDEALGMSTRLQYLASLGRTNVNEYNNDDLERKLPVLCFDNTGEIAEVKDIYIQLPSREECIDETIVEENKEKYQEQKERKEFERTVAVVGSPLDELRFKLQSNPDFLFVVDTAVQGSRLPMLNTLTEKVRKGVDFNELERRVREI